MPKVSVIIPSYNHAAFLVQRIESILDQTYQDFEVLLLDDASTDESREVLAQYASCPKIQIILNEANSGSPFKQWNKGISYAKGDYIWIAESDDYADLLFLKTLVEILDQHSNVGLVYCQSCSVNQDNEILASTYLFWTNDLNSSRWERDFVNSGTAECENFLVCKNTIPNASAVLFRRNLYEKTSRINESFNVAGDWITWAEILFLSDVYFVAKPLNYFRVHCNNTSRSFDRLGLVVRESLRVVQSISAKVQVLPEAKQLSFNNLLNWWITYLWNARFSWRSEIQTFLAILSTFRSLTFWKKACTSFVRFLILKLRSHLKLGTKLRNGFRLSHR